MSCSKETLDDRSCSYTCVECGEHWKCYFWLVSGSLLSLPTHILSHSPGGWNKHTCILSDVMVRWHKTYRWFKNGCQWRKCSHFHDTKNTGRSRPPLPWKEHKHKFTNSERQGPHESWVVSWCGVFYMYGIRMDDSSHLSLSDTHKKNSRPSPRAVVVPIRQSCDSTLQSGSSETSTSHFPFLKKFVPKLRFTGS